MKQNNYHLYNLIATSLQFVKPQPEVDVLESKKNCYIRQDII